MPCIWIAIVTNAIATAVTVGLVPEGHWHIVALWVVTVLGSSGSVMFPGAFPAIRQRILEFSGDKIPAIKKLEIPPAVIDKK